MNITRPTFLELAFLQCTTPEHEAMLRQAISNAHSARITAPRRRREAEARKAEYERQERERLEESRLYAGRR